MKKPEKSELKLCGLAAVQARWKREPESFVRLFFDQATGRRIGTICKALAVARKVYRCVETEELQRIAGTLHHGGIVAVVEAEQEAAPEAAQLVRWALAREPVLVLDRVGNPHNLGALARTAAFLGVTHLVIPQSSEASRANEAAYRVSEGGLEALRLAVVPDLPGFLRLLAEAGYDVIGAATRGGRVLRPGMGGSFSKGTRPVALVLGNEEEGMSREVQAACTSLVTLGGSDAVESLNVSVAGALLMWELLVPHSASSKAVPGPASVRPRRH